MRKRSLPWHPLGVSSTLLDRLPPYSAKLCSTLAASRSCSPLPFADPATCIVYLQASSTHSWAHAAENYTQSALLERSTWWLKNLQDRFFIQKNWGMSKIKWVREEKNRVWSSSSFVTDCKGVAVAAHGSFIAPQLAPLKHVSHPLHICMLTSTLHVPLQIDFGKCKIALVAFVLLPNYCPPLKPAAHTYCNSFGNN